MSRTDRPADTRLLLGYLRPERARIASLGLVLVVAMSLPLAGPLLIGRFVDRAIDGATTGELVAVAAAFLAVTLAGDLLQLVVTWLSVRMAWRIGNRLRHDLCAHALSLDLDWHADHSPGELIERIDGDVDAVTRFSSMAVLALLGNVILVAGILIVASFVDWRASVVIGLTVVAAVGAMIRLRRAAVPFYDAEREVLAGLYGDVEERLGGLEDLRANGAGEWATHRLLRHSSAWWHAARRAALRGDGAMSAAGAVFAAGTVVTLALGVWQARAGVISIGAVLTLVRFSQLASDPIWKVSEQLAEAQKAVAGTRRAARLLGEASVLSDGDEHLPDGPLSVELRDVTFAYGTGRPVLDRLHLTVPAGTSLGVVGRTGSGKTTIGRLVARLWDTEEGAILIGGVDVRAVAQHDLRRRIGLVTQDVELFRASVRDNVTLFGAFAASDEAVEAAITRVGLGDWLASQRDGLDTHVDAGDDLSAGEGQLLAFARLFLADPSVVVLDEASSRLDPVTEARLSSAIDDLLSSRTAIVIAHRLSTLDRMDAIAVLDGGHLVEHGPRATLVAREEGRFRRLLAASAEADEVRS